MTARHPRELPAGIGEGTLVSERGTGTIKQVRIVDGTVTRVDDAARIWAEATAARDGESDVPPLERARPLIGAALADAPQSLLLLAVTAQERAVGFVAAGPVPTTGETTAEVRYVGVRPEVWGSGIGAQLMHVLPAHLAALGFVRAQLVVYLDNDRAVRLYRRHGWRAHGSPTAHPKSGKLQQRYDLDLYGWARPSGPQPCP